MKTGILNPLLLAAGLLAASLAQADNTPLRGITATVAPNGGVELSNTGSTENQGTLVVAPQAAPAPAPSSAAAPEPAAAAAPDAAPTPSAQAPASAAPADSGTQAAAADKQKDPREVYRDTMVQGTPGTAAANPAVSRRYKMMDKSTYQSTVLGNSPTQ